MRYLKGLDIYDLAFASTVKSFNLGNIQYLNCHRTVFSYSTTLCSTALWIHRMINIDVRNVGKSLPENVT